VVLLGIITFFAFYGSVISRAARADQLAAENERLRLYQYKVKLLEDNLLHLRGVVGRLTEMAGIDYEFPELPDDSLLFASMESSDGATVDRPAQTDLHWPLGLPVAGFISQDFETEEVSRFHPGVDIACAIGTPVLATASGEVQSAVYDSVYGYLLVVRHSDSVTTLYGHNDTLLVDSGQTVAAGSRLALSGNTGVSTAPHVHYEVRLYDEPIDPLQLMNYEKE